MTIRFGRFGKSDEKTFPAEDSARKWCNECKKWNFNHKTTEHIRSFQRHRNGKGWGHNCHGNQNNNSSVNVVQNEQQASPPPAASQEILRNPRVQFLSSLRDAMRDSSWLLGRGLYGLLASQTCADHPLFHTCEKYVLDPWRDTEVKLHSNGLLMNIFTFGLFGLLLLGCELSIAFAQLATLIGCLFAFNYHRPKFQNRTNVPAVDPVLLFNFHCRWRKTMKGPRNYHLRHRIKHESPSVPHLSWVGIAKMPSVRSRICWPNTTTDSFIFLSSHTAPVSTNFACHLTQTISYQNGITWAQRWMRESLWHKVNTS